MDTKWYENKNLDQAVNDIVEQLKKNNINIYGDFIVSDYIYEYEYDTVKHNHAMNKDRYNELVRKKSVLYPHDDESAGVRDFLHCMLLSRTDKDLDDIDKERFIIIYMIAAVGHEVYKGEVYHYTETFKKANEYICKFGYDLNNRSKYSFPFEIRNKYADGVFTYFMEDSIVDAICNNVIFEAYGRRTLPYSKKELVMKYLNCSEYQLKGYLEMFQNGNDYAGGNRINEEEIIQYMIEKYDLVKVFQK